jgi:hypothetical protein
VGGGVGGDVANSYASMSDTSSSESWIDGPEDAVLLVGSGARAAVISAAWTPVARGGGGLEAESGGGVLSSAGPRAAAISSGLRSMTTLGASVTTGTARCEGLDVPESDSSPDVLALMVPVTLSSPLAAGAGPRETLAGAGVVAPRGSSLGFVAGAGLGVAERCDFALGLVSGTGFGGIPVVRGALAAWGTVACSAVCLALAERGARRRLPAPTR